jgi:hypothetical protein
MHDELGERLLFSGRADLPQREQAAAGGEDVKVENGFERCVHGSLP